MKNSVGIPANLKASEASGASGASKTSKASPILIISYYWPPCGGAGVQRWLKFAKYLPEFGWEPVILTVDPAFASFPAIDYSLESDIPAGIRVEKTRAINYFSYGKKQKESTGMPAAGFASGDKGSFLNKIARFTRGNFFIPDPRRGWNRYAFKRACELIEELDIRHVVTTSPPHSTQLIGTKLKKRFPAVKWIADLRDPWTDIYYYHQFYPTLIPRLIDSYYEKQALRLADIITQAGSHITTSKIDRYGLDPSKIKILYNGFDDVDFRGLKRNLPPDFTISYVGSVSDQYPVDGLVEAIKKLAAEGMDTRIQFIGPVHESIKSVFTGSLPPDTLTFVPYLEHSEAIKIMMESQLLLLIIPDYSQNRNIIPGKLFEYMGSGNPVLCIGPDGSDVSAILDETGAGKSFTGNDPEQIADFITGIRRDSFDYTIPKKYTRKTLAGKFISYLTESGR